MFSAVHVGLYLFHPFFLLFRKNTSVEEDESVKFPRVPPQFTRFLETVCSVLSEIDNGSPRVVLLTMNRIVFFSKYYRMTVVVYFPRDSQLQPFSVRVFRQFNPTSLTIYWGKLLQKVRLTVNRRLIKGDTYLVDFSWWVNIADRE
jgi:hypothetical protein